MTEEQLGRLFQAFTQADSSTTRNFGGTGLGLTITRHFATMLGGTIDVDEQARQGLDLHAWCCRTSRCQAAPRRARTRVAGSGDGRRPA